MYENRIRSNGILIGNGIRIGGVPPVNEEKQRKDEIISSLAKGGYNPNLLTSDSYGQGGYNLIFNVGSSRFNLMSMSSGLCGEIERTAGQKIRFNISAENIPNSVDDMIELSKLSDDYIARMKGNDGFVSFKGGELKKNAVSLLAGVLYATEAKVKKEETQGEALLSALKKYKGVDIVLEKPYPDGHRYVFNVNGVCVDLNLYIDKTLDKSFIGSIYSQKENELINFDIPLTCMKLGLDNIVGLAQLPIGELQSLTDCSGSIKKDNSELKKILKQYSEKTKSEREITESLLSHPYSSLEPTLL